MAKTIFVILFFMIFKFLGAQNRNYVIVGKKLSVQEVPNTNTFYFKFKNVYKIEQNLSENKIDKDTITFFSYTHIKRIQYSMFDYAIIYLKRNKEGELEHFKTYYEPIILKQDGNWMGYQLTNQNLDDYQVIKNAKPFKIKNSIKILQAVEPDLKHKKKELYLYLQAYYPKQFFRYKSKYKVTPILLKTAEKLVKNRIN